MTRPKGIDLDQYKTQAKELLKQVRAKQPEAFERIRQHHPEHESLINFGKIRLADVQLVLARENGFSSWTKFKQFLLFRNGIAAIADGDLERLRLLLDENPWLARYKCRTGDLYENGYFAGATLLHHIAGNPGDALVGPLPPNIIDIARLLINYGFEKESGNYTISLLLTSSQASRRGVAMPLIDLLIAGGAELDINKPGLLNEPLGNEAPETARELIRRGAKIDIRHAAALGQLDLVKQMVNRDESLKSNLSLIPLSHNPHEAKKQLEQAFFGACMGGQTDVAEFLLGQGVDPTAQQGGQTGFHYAAHMGHLNTVKMLLRRKVPLEVINMYNGTVLGQAIWSAFNEPKPDHPAIIETLISAGAEIRPNWNKWINELRQRAKAGSS